MSKGKVKWFSDLKGYGFITSVDASQDVYVHHTDISVDGYKTLKEGEQVEYEIAQTPEGLKAKNVVRVG
ncbi:MAG: cold shock domain-containing protein [candidate division Zixibacteria bacterium]